jgi:hypothetical protein
MPGNGRTDSAKRGGRRIPPRDIASAALFTILIAVVAVWPSKRRSGASDQPAHHASLAESTNEAVPGRTATEATSSHDRAALDVATSPAGSPEMGASTSSGTSGANSGGNEPDGQARPTSSFLPAGDDTTADWERYLEITRTPLERSPGYVRPYDPEWRSVVRGRREAPEISVPLAGGESSLEALAKAILRGAASRDRRSLRELHMTFEEFDTIVWPELPQSRPVTHALPQDAWMFTHGDMESGITRMIDELGGRSPELAGVAYAEVDTFRNFTIYKDVVFSLRGESVPHEGRYVSVAIERKGRWKVQLYEE